MERGVVEICEAKVEVCEAKKMFTKIEKTAERFGVRVEGIFYAERAGNGDAGDGEGKSFDLKWKLFGCEILGGAGCVPYKGKLLGRYFAEVNGFRDFEIFCKNVETAILLGNEAGINRFFINLRADTLMDFLIEVRALLKEARGGGIEIGIELTEESLSRVNENELEAIRQFLEGYCLVIDDFGTGSANFDRVRVLNPDVVKVDTKAVPLGVGVPAAVHFISVEGRRVVLEKVENDDELKKILKSLKSGMWNIEESAVLGSKVLYQGYCFEKSRRGSFEL